MADVVESVRVPPSLEDARQAAESILAAAAGEGSAEVLVYGSVARGDAHENSDIDFYVLFADIDYARRQDIRKKLEEAANSSVNGCSYNLHVSDLPEWEGRIRLTSAFEHQISRDIVRVAGRLDRSQARWGKEQVRPMTPEAEAQKYLDDILTPRVLSVLGRMKPDPREEPRLGLPLFGVTAEEQNEEREQQLDAEQARLNRLKDLAADCAMTVELALKAAAVLQGTHPPSVKQAGHDISNALALIKGPQCRRLADSVTGHGLAEQDIGRWRQYGTYPDDLDTLQQVADEDVYAYLDTAFDVAQAVCGQYEAVGLDTSRLKRRLAEFADLRWSGHIRWADQTDAEATLPVP